MLDGTGQIIILENQGDAEELMPFRGIVYIIFEYLDWLIEKEKLEGKKKEKCKLPAVVLWCLHFDIHPYSYKTDLDACHQNSKWSKQNGLAYKLLLTDFGAMEDEVIQHYGAASVPILLLKYGRRGQLLSILESKSIWFRKALPALSDHCIECILAYSLALKEGKKIVEFLSNLLLKAKKEVIMTYGRELELRGEKRGKKLGKELGKKLGEKIGMMRGAKMKAHEMVSNMLKNGLALSKISELTGVGEEELAALLSS